MNILILSAGTRNLLVSYFLKSRFDKVVAVDASELAPALYLATKHYVVPRMSDPNYLNTIIDICKKEEINAVLPLQEDELNLISDNFELFENEGIKAIVSGKETIRMCRDKYEFFLFLKKNSLPSLNTFSCLSDFEKAYSNGDISLPVFIKPRFGCGSADSFVANNIEFIKSVIKNYNEEFVIQEFNKGKEYGVDVYCDLITGEVINIFIKEKLRMRAGETEKSISIINDNIFKLVEKTVSLLNCKGPIDIDLFEVDGHLYISEINPRFGGGYPHAYLCGVDFPHLIFNNLTNEKNKKSIGKYKQGVIALKMQDIYIK